MDTVELVLAMLLAVIASGYLVRMLPFSLPLPLMQIGLAALAAERDMLAMARQCRISDQTARKLVREIDLLEARYR